MVVQKIYGCWSWALQALYYGKKIWRQWPWYCQPAFTWIRMEVYRRFPSSSNDGNITGKHGTAGDIPMVCWWNWMPVATALEPLLWRQQERRVFGIEVINGAFILPALPTRLMAIFPAAKEITMYGCWPLMLMAIKCTARYTAVRKMM